MGVSGSDIFVLQFDCPVISNFVPRQCDQNHAKYVGARSFKLLLAEFQKLPIAGFLSGSHSLLIIDLFLNQCVLSSGSISTDAEE